MTSVNILIVKWIENVTALLISPADQICLFWSSWIAPFFMSSSLDLEFKIHNGLYRFVRIQKTFWPIIIEYLIEYEILGTSSWQITRISYSPGRFDGANESACN